MDKLRSLAPLLFLLAVGAAATAIAAANGVTPKDIAAWGSRLAPWAQQHQIVAGALYVLVLAGVVASATPGSIMLTITGGALFGLTTALPLSLLGELGGSTAIFLASRRAFQSRASNRKPPSGLAHALAERIRHGYLRAPARYTMFLCAVPILPSGGLSIALAWLGCPLKTFLIASAIGRGAMLACETGLGSGLNRVLAGEGFDFAALLHPAVLLPLGGLLILLVVPTMFQRLRRSAVAPAQTR